MEKMELAKIDSGWFLTACCYLYCCEMTHVFWWNFDREGFFLARKSQFIKQVHLDDCFIRDEK